MAVTRVSKPADPKPIDTKLETSDVPTPGERMASIIATNRVIERATELVVTAGEHRFSPIQFFSFEVAQVQMRIMLKDGDDPKELAKEALALLREIQKAEFREALAQHRKQAAEALKAVE